MGVHDHRSFGGGGGGNGKIELAKEALSQVEQTVELMYQEPLTSLPDTFDLMDDKHLSIVAGATSFGVCVFLLRELFKEWRKQLEAGDERAAMRIIALVAEAGKMYNLIERMTGTYKGDHNANARS